MYYVYLNEEQTGPYSKEQIIDMIKTGALNSAYIYGENYPDWVLPRDTEEFAGYFNDAATVSYQAGFPVYFYYNETQSQVNTPEELKDYLAAIQDQENLYIYSNEKNDWVFYNETAAPYEEEPPLQAEPEPDPQLSFESEIIEKASLPEEEKKDDALETMSLQPQQPLTEKAETFLDSASPKPAVSSDLQQTNCKFHSSKAADLLCAGCKADICEDCQNLFNGKVLCPDCLKKMKSKHKIKTIIEIIVAVILFIILGVLFYFFVLQ